jgi:hypothetical protein
MFTFSENQSYRIMVVPPRSSRIVAGWHRSNQRSS